jgi:chromosome segregation ATPase
MKLSVAVAIAALVAVASTAAPAVAAPSKVRTLTGQVTAAPYVVKRKVVVPVLLDQKSARRAKLRAPVGVLLVKKSKKVKVRGQRQRVAPDLLRAGDRLRARAKTTREARRAAYWRMSPKKFTVTKRSTALSPAELAGLLAGLGSDLSRLEGTLTALAGVVQAGFAELDGKLDALGTSVTSLGAALAALEKRVEELEKGLPALEARLQSQIDSLSAGLAALGTQVNGLGAQIAALQSALAALDGDVTGLQGEIDALETSVTQLTNQVAALQANMDIVCGPTSPLNALC